MQLCDIYSENIGASGIASPYYEEDIEEESVGSQSGDNTSLLEGCHVKLSKVLEVWLDPNFEDSLVWVSKLFNLSFFSNSQSCIWIRTHYAWYILQEPSQQYWPIFKPILIVYMMSHLIANVLQEKPRLYYDEFLKALDSEVTLSLFDANVAATRFLGRKLSTSDLQIDTVVSLFSLTLKQCLKFHFLILLEGKCTSKYLWVVELAQQQILAQCELCSEFSRPWCVLVCWLYCQLIWYDPFVASVISTNALIRWLT